MVSLDKSRGSRHTSLHIVAVVVVVGSLLGNVGTRWLLKSSWPGSWRLPSLWLVLLEALELLYFRTQRQSRMEDSAGRAWPPAPLPSRGRKSAQVADPPRVSLGKDPPLPQGSLINITQIENTSQAT